MCSESCKSRRNWSMGYNLHLLFSKGKDRLAGKGWTAGLEGAVL